MLWESLAALLWPSKRSFKSSRQLARSFTLLFGGFKVERLPLYWGHLQLHESEMGSPQCSCEKRVARHVVVGEAAAVAGEGTWPGKAS